MSKKNVPKIIGSNGRPLYGLCAEMAPAKIRWMIADSTETYLKLVQNYQNEANPVIKAQLLKDLTFLSEFNESEIRNVVSTQLQDKVDKKSVYRRENANRRDAMNQDRATRRDVVGVNDNAPKVQQMESITSTRALISIDDLSSPSPEDAIIEAIDRKRAAEKAEKAEKAKAKK